MALDAEQFLGVGGGGMHEVFEGFAAQLG